MRRRLVASSLAVTRRAVVRVAVTCISVTRISVTRISVTRVAVPRVAVMWRAAGSLAVCGLVAIGFAQMAPAAVAQEWARIEPRIVGDAIPTPLTGVPGDAGRGRAIVLDRQAGLCLLCHTGPFPEERFQGNLAPDLAGVGERLGVGQLRLRLVDSRIVQPQSVMPAYFRTQGLSQVGRPWQGKTVLTAQQIEDVVAFLATLRH